MKTSEFQTWLEQLPRLSRGQAEQVRRRLGETPPPAQAVQWLEYLHEPRCPACQGAQYYRWGHQAGLQRFRCRACGRTFTEISATPLAHLRAKEHWLKICEALMNGMTVRASAKVCGVDKNTSFRWRHRFLALLATVKADHLQGDRRDRRDVLSPLL